MSNNQHLQDCHELFNAYFFNGMLNYIKIIETDYIELYGFPVWGYYHKGEIAITNNGLIYLTLLHEMIHQYQDEFNLKDKDHGKDFKAMARYIELTLNINKDII